jgi:hypothetical protein
MISIPFPPQTDNAWRDWVADCEVERNLLIAAAAAGQHRTIKSSLYKRQKARFFAMSNGKCAYCESFITATQRGDVEHFRPKNAVSDFNFNRVQIPVVNGGFRPHPGYYWMAYDPLNLLPACIICNQVSGRRPHTRGKGTRFPVNGQYATQPGEELLETPLLVHPYRDQPDEHLRFEPNGVLVPLTPRGEVTRDVLDLNRDELVSNRRDAYLDAHALAVNWALSAASNAPDVHVLEQQLGKHLDGAKSFSAVGRLAIRKATERLNTGLSALGLIRRPGNGP